MTTKCRTITVGEFRERIWNQLSAYPDETPVYFGQGDLVFYRVKDRGDSGSPFLQIEFNQVYKLMVDPDAED